MRSRMSARDGRPIVGTPAAGDPLVYLQFPTTGLLTRDKLCKAADLLSCLTLTHQPTRQVLYL